MILEGERIKELLRRAESDVLLCSPFVKARSLEALLGVVSPNVRIVVVTRWRPAEVAAGLTDLEVFDLAKDRPGTELRLLNVLHAKLYVADDRCLVGSANLTAAALGWKPDTNLELLIPAERDHPDIAFLLARLDAATPATFQIRDEVARLAAALDHAELDDAVDMARSVAHQVHTAWLPRCAAPDRLYEVYQDPRTTVVAEGTRTDALADLADMVLPNDLAPEELKDLVGQTIARIPSFEAFLESVPAGLTDAQGQEITARLRTGLDGSDVRKQWQIVREWIGVFFGDRFEVAPQTYVVRLRSR